MPLAFQSQSHGTIAFGFFNIASDMLLLERLFLFCTDFTAAVLRLRDSGSASLQGFEIRNPRDRGDLMGAIHGLCYTGFIGATYRRWPFPAEPEGFRQDPGGAGTQAEVRALIAPYGVPVEIALTSDPVRGEVAIADYRFDRAGFQALLDYVWRGGYPRWRDDAPPASVREMRQATSGHWTDWNDAGTASRGAP